MLQNIFGHLNEFAGDQYGSRLVQQKLQQATPEDRERIFEEIMPNAYAVMTDVFGNYVVQKMFEQGDQAQKARLAKEMEGKMLTLSMQMYGCRVSPSWPVVVKHLHQTPQTAVLSLCLCRSCRRHWSTCSQTSASG